MFRRTCVFLASLLFISALVTSTAHAREGARPRPCNFQWFRGHHHQSIPATSATGRCLADRYGVSRHTVTTIAECESHWHAWDAYNGNLGVLQLDRGHFWAYWYDIPYRERQRLRIHGIGPFNARSNLAAGIHHMREGLRYWSCRSRL